MQKNYTISVRSNNPYDYDTPRFANTTEEVSETIIDCSSNSPYIKKRVTVTGIFKEYNPDYGDSKLCKCGHTYYRHFDSYENMAPVGCKYCGCEEFVPVEEK